MLVIRLARTGRENLQTFRLVVQEKTTSPKRGKIVAAVGSYDPTNPENKLIFDAEKIEQFIKNGATPSDTVARLLLKNGFKKELVEKFVVKYSKQKPKKEAPAEEAKPAAPAAAPAEEKKEEAAPADEPKAEEAPVEKPAEPVAEEKPAKET
ncbi:MAG: 30S ribosomal protein S16, partial [Patescibacteria group bacterium]